MQGGASLAEVRERVDAGDCRRSHIGRKPWCRSRPCRSTLRTIINWGIALDRQLLGLTP